MLFLFLFASTFSRFCPLHHPILLYPVTGQPRARHVHPLNLLHKNCFLYYYMYIFPRNAMFYNVLFLWSIIHKWIFFYLLHSLFNINKFIIIAQFSFHSSILKCSSYKINLFLLIKFIHIFKLNISLTHKSRINYLKIIENSMIKIILLR